jgi:hypothetical protein
MSAPIFEGTHPKTRRSPTIIIGGEHATRRQIKLLRQAEQAEHIEDGYEHRGVSHKDAERRASVNKETHGGKTSGSGRGKREDHSLHARAATWEAKRPCGVRQPNVPSPRTRPPAPEKGERPNKWPAARS